MHSQMVHQLLPQKVHSTSRRLAREEIVAIVGPCIRFPDFLAMASSPVGFRQWKKAGVYVISVTDILEDIYQITSQSSIY